MFNLSALVILTIVDLIAVLQVASMTPPSHKFQGAFSQATPMLCLAVSLTGLGLALLVPEPGMGIAVVSIAALVNLLAVLGPGLRCLGSQPVTSAASHLRGLARLSLAGSACAPAAAGAQTGKQSGKTVSRPIPLREIRSLRPGRLAALRMATDPTMRAMRAAHTSPQRSQASQSTRTGMPALRAPHVNIEHLRPSPRETYTVPRRPNRLPTTSLAFLLRVEPEQMPDIFAEARESMRQRPALAKRVRLVSTEPWRPATFRSNSNPLPDTFSEPDPAWVTSYGRLTALSRSA